MAYRGKERYICGDMYIHNLCMYASRYELERGDRRSKANQLHV